MEARQRLSSQLGLLAYYTVADKLPSSDFPLGGLWRRARQFCCRRFLNETSGWINVEPGVYLASGANIRLGDGSGFGRGCRVYGAHVGEGVIIAPEVVFLTRTHNTEATDRPIGKQGLTEPMIPVVEDWAWIGTRTIVLPGRRIGRGAIVGAGSVVSRDVEPFTVVAGNPARVIRRRPRASGE